MDIRKKYATDPVKETEGAWVDFDDGKILVARLGNRKYARLLAKQIEAHAEILERKDDAADAKSDEIMAYVVSETILHGWDEKITYDGKAYSKAIALEALQHADFRRRVMEKAGEVEHFRLKVEEAQGNA